MLKGKPAVLLVDPVRYGEGYKAAVRDLGFTVASLYTSPYSSDRVGHEKGDDLSLYAGDVDSAAREIALAGLDVHAVVPTIEAAVYLGDMLAERLNVPGNDHSLAWARRNKAAMRERAVETGVAVPDFRLVGTVAEIADAAQEIGFPAIAKPTMGSCSQGITVLPDAEAVRDLSGMVTHDLFGQPVEQWLVEQYVRGAEFAVNCYTAEGEHRVVDIWQYRQPDDRDYDFPVWETLQLDESHPDHERVSRYVKKVLDAYGIQRGPSHTEVKCNDSGVYLMEIGARQPGGPAVEMWARHSSVIRPYHDSIECYLGRRPAMMDKALEFQAVFGSMVLRNDGPPGTLVAIHGLDGLEGLPGIDKIMVEAAPGDHLDTTRDSTALPFSAFVTGPDAATVLATLATIRSTVSLEIRPDPLPEAASAGNAQL
ncbi:ATP-grasp domain-containing protein [Streptomyces sp. 150FB]|uniref:ATP-grasp domain-containing protein n=1 Tax=Streptomyces sp. 150FB TaxID=1576605 RepID=UPI000698145D|nr:ATP-grasp domain-containing protein [Streptomyces sp. 150FB]